MFWYHMFHKIWRPSLRCFHIVIIKLDTDLYTTLTQTKITLWRKYGIDSAVYGTFNTLCLVWIMIESIYQKSKDCRVLSVCGFRYSEIYKYAMISNFTSLKWLYSYNINIEYYFIWNASIACFLVWNIISFSFLFLT